MSPQFRCLLSKEWTERRQSLLWGIGIMVYLLGYCVAYEFEYRTRAFVASYYSMCMLFGCFGSLLSSMFTAAGEYSRGTLKFSDSLPTSRWTIAWSRLIAMWGCLVIPIIVTSVVATVILGCGLIEQAGLRTEDYNTDGIRLPQRPSISPIAAISFLWTVTAIAVCEALYLSTLISLIGTWCRREATVAFLGVIIVLISFESTEFGKNLANARHTVASQWIGGVFPQSLAIPWGYGELDGSSYTDLELAPQVAGPLTVNLFLSLALGAWFATHYGSRSETTATVRRRWWSPQMPHLLSRLPIQLPGRWAALVWLNARQSIPLCVSGLVVAGLLTLISLREMRSYPTLESRFIRQLPESTWMLGMLWGAIVAVGVFGAETKSGIDQFWRSRPIPPRMWFWVKYGIGLASLLITLDVLPSLGLWSLGQRTEVGSGYQLIGLRSSLYCLPLLHARAYSFTVAAICLLRRPIHGAVLGLMLSFGTDALIESIPVFPKLSTMDVFNNLDGAEEKMEPLDLIEAGYPLVYGTVAALIVIATLLARKTIVPPRSSLVCWIVFVLTLFCSTAHAQEAQHRFATDLAGQIERRDEGIHDLSLKLSVTIHHTGDEILTTGKPMGSNARAGKPSTESFLYTYYQQGKQRAWKQFDPSGTLLSAASLDGNLRSDYAAQGDSFVRKQNPPLQLLFPNPYGMLLEQINLATSFSLPEVLKTQLFDSLQQREIDGEQLIDVVITYPARSQEVFTDGRLQTISFMGHRLQMTVNATRQYWPVKIFVDQLADASGTIQNRYEVTASGWVKSGSTVFPQKIEQIISAPRSNLDVTRKEPPEFLVTQTNTCEVLEADVNQGLPDQIFASSIPAGVGYYDMEDRRQYVRDESGAIKPYVPKPRGIRGVVFLYLATTVVLILICLFRQPTIFARSSGPQMSV